MIATTIVLTICAADGDAYVRPGRSGRIAHAVSATILLALVGLHVAAALYHQFIVKDYLLAGMPIVKRSDS